MTMSESISSVSNFFICLSNGHMVPHCQRFVIVAGFSVVHLSVVKFDCARNEAMHDKCYAADMCKCLYSSKSRDCMWDLES